MRYLHWVLESSYRNSCWILWLLKFLWLFVKVGNKSEIRPDIFIK